MTEPSGGSKDGAKGDGKAPSMWLTAMLDPVQSQAMRALIPRITTERLILRAPCAEDFPAYAEVFTSPRAIHIGGPYSQDEALADFTQAVAGWLLLGTGAWTITGQHCDAPLGWVYLWREFGDPEPEIGWILTEAAEGRGIATEAARAILPRGFALFGSGGLVSYIDPDNHASIAVARKLGARRDSAAEAGVADWGVQVYRHYAEGSPHE